MGSGMLRKGQVKNYNTERGFGFIRPENGAKDIFFHIRDFPTGYAPQVAERVSYWIEQKGDKLAAKNITRLDAENAEIPPTHEWQIQPTALSMHKLSQNTSAEHDVSQKLQYQNNDSGAYRKTLYPHYRKRVSLQGISAIFGRLIGLFITFFMVTLLVQWGLQYYNELKNRQILRLAVPQAPEQIAAEPTTQLYAAIQAPPRIVEPPKSTTNANVVVNTTSSGASNFKCDGRTHCSQMHSYAEAVWFINHCPSTQMDGNHDGEPCEQQFGRGH